jgi:aminoglycoside/choline kinase family phosphotransferase
VPQRLQQLSRWLHEQAGLVRFELEPASTDASFRRYFRVRCSGRTLIAMDAPPGREDVRPYVGIARAFHGIGLNVPEILNTDLEQGFLLISDLGTRLYLAELNDATVERLYGDALGALAVLQACGPGDYALPPYSRDRLLTEMQLFRHWYLQRHLGLELNPEQGRILEHAFGLLADSALAQPVVPVHRDYHSRNLLVTERNNPGIVDFQDAVMGPLTYDLVSLLRDCYIAWPRERVEDWALGFRDLALHSGILRQEHGDAEFLRWFDLMGVQRHLKATGIFARLNYRDGKSGYLQDIPRTMGYVMEVSSRHPELAPFHELLRRLPTGQRKGDAAGTLV